MTPEQRKRAARAVAERIAEMGSNPTTIARKAHVSPSTLLGFLAGSRWPTDQIQDRIEDALGWRHGGIVTRAVRGGLDGALEELTDVELTAELLRRMKQRERETEQNDDAFAAG